jgi:hypothetical protein
MLWPLIVLPALLARRAAHEVDATGDGHHVERDLLVGLGTGDRFGVGLFTVREFVHAEEALEVDLGILGEPAR